jgi:hypothetical protein
MAQRCKAPERAASHLNIALTRALNDFRISRAAILSVGWNPNQFCAAKQIV